MKIKTSILALTKAFFILLVICCFLSRCNNNRNWNVKKGQIWIKEYNVENPYEQVERDTIIILEVWGDFVKYKRHGEIQSDNKYWIPVNARLLK